ncbi:unnamed protein product [Penicillium glandicola]
MPFGNFKHHRDGANAFKERILNGISNQEILAEVPGEESKRFSDHVYELPRDQLTKSRLPDVAKYKLQLHASFNKPDPDADYSDHDNVYLVGRPNRWARRLSQTPKPCRWSIYTWRHFYHLRLADGTQGPSIVLRDDHPRDWKPLDGPFIAYHIGMTDYNDENITLLARWVITQLDHNTLSTVAYEQFVFGLAMRILRAPSNTTAFIGNFWHIMHQDIGYSEKVGGGPTPAPSGFLTGVRLADPDEDISTRIKRWYLIYRIETDARGLDRCWKRGRLGQISWKTHEFHPFIRPLALGPPAVTNILTKVGQRIPVLSRFVPPVYQKEMPIAAIYRRRKATPLPSGFVLVHYYASLFYIRAKYPMDDKEFYFRVHALLNSVSVKHLTFNRGFNDEFLFGADQLAAMNAAALTEEKVQSSSSTVVGKESEESELTVDAKEPAGEMLQPDSGTVFKEERLFDTLDTHWFEHKGVKCQVLIDMTDRFASPVEI